MNHLVPCAACSRHVRDTEAACPFCSASIALTPKPVEIAGRLGRAALFAFQATTVAATLNACGPTPAPTTVEPPETTIMQPYGAPPLPPPTTVTPPPTTTVPATDVPPEAQSAADDPPSHVHYVPGPAPEDDHGHTLHAAYGGAPPGGPEGL